MLASSKNSLRGLFLFSLFIMAFIIAGLLPPRAFAQSASVSGRVTDQVAAIADAEVKIRNIDTSASQATKTNGDGFYSLSGLQPGRYSLAVSKPQFKNVSVDGITLNVEDNLSRNVVLPVGPATESVTVDGKALSDKVRAKLS